MGTNKKSQKARSKSNTSLGRQSTKEVKKVEQLIDQVSHTEDFKSLSTCEHWTINQYGKCVLCGEVILKGCQHASGISKDKRCLRCGVLVKEKKNKSPTERKSRAKVHTCTGRDKEHKIIWHLEIPDSPYVKAYFTKKANHEKMLELVTKPTKAKVLFITAHCIETNDTCFEWKQ